MNLNTGYRLSMQGLKPITLPSGDYALAAIAMDGDRIGLLGAMPVMVMESNDQGAITHTSVPQNGTFTAQFRYDTPCERLGVVVLRDVAYNGTAVIDAAVLGTTSLDLNLTYNGTPATQKLIGNVYVSLSSGKYVVVANTNRATVSTSGLEAGSYQVYMVGQSANGTMQAYGEHPLTITPGGSIAVTSVPTGAAIYLDGTDTGVVTNGTLTAVPAGTHNVTVTLAGYGSVSSSVTVVAGQTATVHFDLIPVGSIAVTSVPAGAAICLDGTAMGVVTNGTLTCVPAGNHTVMVTLTGYNSASSNVTVVANQTATVHFALTPAPTPTPTPHHGGGGGGGGSSSSAPASYTTTGTLLTSSSGTVLKSVILHADDNVANLRVPIGVTALDADGNRLSDITINPLTGDEVPDVPAGAIFQFAGYAYEAGPAGATFSPGITLT
ncbi:MAG: PKD domain containing protein, partial [Methanomicrobiales archaeon 53_19]